MPNRAPPTGMSKELCCVCSNGVNPGSGATSGQGGPTPDFANVMIMPLTRKCHVYRQLSWWDMMVMLLCVRGKSGVHKEDVTLVHFGSGLLPTARGWHRVRDHNGILMWAGHQYTRRQVTRDW